MAKNSAHVQALNLHQRIILHLLCSTLYIICANVRAAAFMTHVFYIYIWRNHHRHRHILRAPASSRYAHINHACLQHICCCTILNVAVVFGVIYLKRERGGTHTITCSYIIAIHWNCSDGGPFAMLGVFVCVCAVCTHSSLSTHAVHAYTCQVI